MHTTHSKIKFSNYFFRMNIYKVTNWRRAGGKWGNHHNFLLEVELLVFTNIQVISTIVCLNWMIMGP